MALTVEAVGELVGHHLSDAARAGGKHLVDTQRVVNRGRMGVPPCRAAIGGLEPRQVDIVLYGEGQPVERAGGMGREVEALDQGTGGIGEGCLGHGHSESENRLERPADHNRFNVSRPGGRNRRERTSRYPGSAGRRGQAPSYLFRLFLWSPFLWSHVS